LLKRSMRIAGSVMTAAGIGMRPLTDKRAR
jgi:hypothetical protein